MCTGLRHGRILTAAGSHQAVLCAHGCGWATGACNERHNCVSCSPSHGVSCTPQLVAYVYQLVDGEVKVDKARGLLWAYVLQRPSDLSSCSFRLSTSSPRARSRLQSTLLTRARSKNNALNKHRLTERSTSPSVQNSSLRQCGRSRVHRHLRRCACTLRHAASAGTGALRPRPRPPRASDAPSWCSPALAMPVATTMTSAAI